MLSFMTQYNEHIELYIDILDCQVHILSWFQWSQLSNEHACDLISPTQLLLALSPQINLYI